MHRTVSPPETDAPAGKATAPRAANPRHRTASRRWVPWIAAAGLIGLLVVGLWSRPEPVETARVVRSRLQEFVSEEGRTRIRHRFVIAAPVAGQLRRIELKPGDMVEPGGAPVVLLDPISPVPLDVRSRALAEARLETARAQLAKARSAHQFAETDLRRFERLHGERTVSQQELETVQWRETAAARDLAAAESGVRLAAAELAVFDDARPDGSGGPPVVIRSPVRGRVLRVFQESARVVVAGAPLIEVGDPEDLEVVVEVLSIDAASLRPGAPVEMEQWGGTNALRGRVRVIEPAAFTKVSALGVEEQRVRIVVDLLDRPADRGGLGDDYRVEARIIRWESPEVAVAPVGAVFRRGSQWTVFVVESGRVRQRAVAVGHGNGRAVEITGGVGPGDELVMYPSDRIGDGGRVRVIQVGAE